MYNVCLNAYMVISESPVHRNDTVEFMCVLCVICTKNHVRTYAYVHVEDTLHVIHE